MNTVGRTLFACRPRKRKRYLFRLGGVYGKVSRLGARPDDHALIDCVARLDVEFSAGLDAVERVARGFPALCRHKTAQGVTGFFRGHRVWLKMRERRADDRASARVVAKRRPKALRVGGRGWRGGARLVRGRRCKRGKTGPKK